MYDQAGVLGNHEKVLQRYVVIGIRIKVDNPRRLSLLAQRWGSVDTKGRPGVSLRVAMLSITRLEALNTVLSQGSQA